ncbi:MAG: hypothetical protein JXB85_17670 [Anaerolineales bacterium]|nr:hypothetical protein [Anaerolineales bacterium]
MKLALLQQFRYRAQNYFTMIGMIAEPVIYRVVWSTVADQQGGSVGGTRQVPRPEIRRR